MISAEVIGDESVVLRHGIGLDLRDFPAGRVAVDAVDEGFNLEEIWQRLEQVVILLVRQLVLHVKVAHHDDGGKSQNLLLAPAELGVLHVALHDRHQGLGIGEVGVGNFVKNHGVSAADDADLAVALLMNSPAGVALPPERTCE